MALRIDDLLERIARLERELETEVNRARQQWRYRIEAGRVRFERDVRVAHRRLKQSIPRFLRESSVANLLTAPLIYSLVVPIALLDLWISLYQAVCFRAYGVARVRRSTYIVIDRQHLEYHASRVRGPHGHYRYFVDYGDAAGYRRRLLPLRHELHDRATKGDS